MPTTIVALAQRPPLPATGAGMLLAIGCAVAAIVVVLRFSGLTDRPTRMFTAGAAGGLVFQVMHVLEHALQVGFWAADTSGKPWLSAWAAGTADGLGYFCSLVKGGAGSAPTMGVEALHLTGNLIFLGGLASWHLARTTMAQRPMRSLTIAERVQMVHVGEHLVLVATLVTFGEAWGLSTAFGLVGGSTATALRVWFHFGINTLATGWALRAAYESRRETLAPATHTATDRELLAI